MANCFGKKMTRCEAEARVGSMKQLCGIRSATLNDGREDGLRILEMNNGCFSAVFVPGRCLDMSSLSYRGIPLGFTGKCGLVHPAYADPVLNPLRSVNGGLFYTCGLTNVGAAYGEDYFHGRIRLIPAEQVCASSEWDGDEYRLSCSGTMRQNSVCGENLSLTRTIGTALCEPSIHIRDVVRNEGFAPSPFMFMYHVVFGFPLLDINSELLLPVDRDCLDKDCLRVFDPTPEGADNGGGSYRVSADENGFSSYALYNPNLGIGLAVTYTASGLPILNQWKSMQSGDYAMGIMPANCAGDGRQREIERGTLPMLEAGQTVSFELTFTAIDGERELDAFRARMSTYRP